MFVTALPRIALIAASLTLAFGVAQAQTHRVGEPAPSASKTKTADARFKAKTKAKTKLVRRDARRDADLRKSPKGKKINVKSRHPAVTRPAAAPSAAQLNQAPRAQRINGVPPKNAAVRAAAKAPNLRITPKRTRAARTPVRDANLRRCAPGDTRVECRQQRIRNRTR